MIYNNKSLSKFFFKISAVLFISLAVLNKVSADEKKWTISAVEFKFTQDIKRTEYEKSLLKAVPKLILDQLNGIKVRNVSSAEFLDRDIDALVKERLALFLELSSESKKRDSYVLQELSEYQFNKLIKESEKKIQDINKRIDTNLKKQEDLLNEQKKFSDAPENFEFYKNDSDNLFVIMDQYKDYDYSSYQFSTEVNKAGIDGLVTGNVVTYGNYAAVTAELYIYPGAKSVGVITEVGNISKIESIAKNISYRLIPLIENAIPCEVKINFTDEELRKKAKLTVDNTVYPVVPEKIVLGTGVHNLTFECDGYRKESFSYGFGYEKKYVIEIDFVKAENIDTAVILKNPIAGSLFYNGNIKNDNVVSVKVNNMSVLGYFQSENDNSLYFIIPGSLLVNDTAVTANLKDFDIGANIEKRRKLMYISYSALVCSLPYLFYSYSNYNNLYRSYELGNTVDLNKLRTYQTMSYIGIGVSVGLGGWFIYELVRYLVDANKALPVEVKKSDSDFNSAVTDFESMQKLFNEMEQAELERQKAEDQQNNSVNDHNIQNKEENK